MPLTLVRSCPRLWSLDSGTVMVVTDLHGDWDAYRRYRDHFVDLQAKGQADCLIFTGDLIHRDAPTHSDCSLEIVLDVISLQGTFGEAIICLCGNHELPHIYGFGLSKGEVEYAPDFEAALSQSSRRSSVIGFLCSLPFFIRTAAGVSLTHAGASESMREEQNVLKLFTWSHQEQLAKADAWLADKDIDGLRRAYAKLSQVKSYAALAKHYLSVTEVNDPRYDDLLRGFAATASDEFQLLHSALFTKCEREYKLAEYTAMLANALQNLSVGYVPQRILVAGHMTIPNGYEIVARRHLRLASGCHATPREAGLYLLFDTAQPLEGAVDLLTNLHSVYDIA
jgi:hypothetical protein